MKKKNKEFKQALQATGKVLEALRTEFNKSSQNAPCLYSGAGLDRDIAGWCVSVDLTRQPTETEKLTLPKICDGVRVKYSIPVEF